MTRENCELVVKRLKEHNSDDLRFSFMRSSDWEALIRTWMEFEIDDFDHTSKMWFLPEEEFQVELKEWNKLKKTFAKMIERQSYWMDQIDKEETK